MHEDEELFWGEVWVQGDRIILAAGQAAAAEQLSKNPLQWDREIDCEGNLLLPGFKNAHTHSAMTFLRSYADDMPLQ